MTRDTFARNQCHQHALKLINERELDLDISDIVQIEATIRKCRAIIVRPTATRYRFGIHHRCTPYTVVYDSEADAVLSVWRGIARNSFDIEEIVR